ncbi:PREDICTED: proline-rich membrane anchor 1 [Haliaeetus leucocephalus]|uniref:proline-rich membrane anchor 1 n=1 Tax=Haliaeetus leucocephalus TaxID=52644 RepID=UPI00053CE624|nr:PREDICTED: proline-rich membrane anchor 1 [Haliaeetus leucocephalus]
MDATFVECIVKETVEWLFTKIHCGAYGDCPYVHIHMGNSLLPPRTWIFLSEPLALWDNPQVTRGEPQKSCSKPVAEKVTESCQQICQCRPPPPLPPPPPPPPPPRLLVVPTPKSTFCPTEETWWPGLVIIIAVCCATLVFLFVVVIICYKAIKRKPMRKEENGTSRAEYAMTSSQNSKTVDNNAVV